MNWENERKDRGNGRKRENVIMVADIFIHHKKLHLMKITTKYQPTNLPTKKIVPLKFYDITNIYVWLNQKLQFAVCWLWVGKRKRVEKKREKIRQKIQQRRLNDKTWWWLIRLNYWMWYWKYYVNQPFSAHRQNTMQ